MDCGKAIRKQLSLILSEQQCHQPREAPQQCAPPRRQAGRLSAGSGAQAGPGRVGKAPRRISREDWGCIERLLREKWSPQRISLWLARVGRRSAMSGYASIFARTRTMAEIGIRI